MLKHDLRTLTLIVTIMVIIDTLWNPMLLLGTWARPDYFEFEPGGGTAAQGLGFLFKFATMIVFGRWIYVAGDNLVAAGHSDLEFTPGSRIWWFAVPFANLVKPFQGMRELWNASHGDTDYTASSGLVTAWWALWLLQSFLGRLAMTGAPVAIFVSQALNIGLAIVAIDMIRRIATAQRTFVGTGDLEEVFA